MSANDETAHPWIRTEIALMRSCFDAAIPIAGICLGGQMLARALGGKVTTNPHPEIGWFEIQVTSEGQRDPILSSAGLTPSLYQWHYDTFHLPPGAELLAESPICPRQAYRVGAHAYGFQFHPEADRQLVDEWLNIEGTDDEILDARMAHHDNCVQSPDAHRKNAVQGELSSLSFVAAISQLFQSRDPFVGADSGVRERLERAIARRTKTIVHFFGSHGGITPVLGTIERIADIPKGQFVFLREASELIWPIRLDHIHHLEDATD